MFIIIFSGVDNIHIYRKGQDGRAQIFPTLGDAIEYIDRMNPAGQEKTQIVQLCGDLERTAKYITMLRVKADPRKPVTE